MKKITVIAAFMVAIAFAAYAEAQTYLPMTKDETVASNADYSVAPNNYGYIVTSGRALTVLGKLGGVQLEEGTGVVTNSGTINILDYMKGGTFANNGTVGGFGTAGITDGAFTNNGTVNGTTLLSGTGVFTNNAGKTVAALTQKGGRFENSGTVSAINGFTAGTFNNNGTVSAINGDGITGGVFNNNGTINGSVVALSGDGELINGGAITNGVTLSGNGKFTNSTGKTVGTLTQNGGTVTNNGTVTTLTQNSGTVTNNATIANLNYAGGTYSKGTVGTGGSIGTLNASGNVTGTDWGTVTNLNLNGGSLDLNIGAGLNLTGWEGTVANVVDLDGAIVNFVLGMSLDDFGTFLEGFKADDPDAGLFDTTIVREFDLLKGLFGIDATIENSDKASYLFTIDEYGYQGVWDDSFYAGLTFDGGIFTLEWKTGSDPNALPEPATLAIFGLGLVGLGVARARRRK